MSNERKFDLSERTAVFGEKIIEFGGKVPKNVVTFPLINQLIRSGTSVGANYYEADCAETRRDFEHKIGICKKEANETRYWLRMIAKAAPELREPIVVLWREADELRRIFISIVRTSQANTKNILESALDIRN